MSDPGDKKNPEIMRERAERLRGIRADLKGVAWTMLCVELIRNAASLIAVRGIVGWKLGDRLNDPTLDAAGFQALVSALSASDWYANAISILNVLVAALGLIPVIVYARKREMSLKSCAPLRPSGFREIGVMLLALLGINSLGTLGVVATELMFNAAGYSIYVEIMMDQTSFSYWIMAVYAVILAPMIEEYTFRGVLLEGIRPYGERFAVISTAVMFGLTHGNLMQFLPAALTGWFLGYIRVRTGSLSLCVLLHGLNNLVGLLMDKVISCAGESAAVYLNIGYLALTAVMLLLVWRGLKARYALPSEGEEQIGYTAFLSVPALIWLYLVFRMMIMNVSQLA